jgi:cytochrome b561
MKVRQDYSWLQKASHWGIAILCVLEFPTAWSIQKAHLGHAFGIRPPTSDQILAITHEWAGWLILLLGGVLLWSRLLQGAPRLPIGMKFWQRALACAAHSAIYLAIVALVASGIAAMYVDARLAYIHIALTKIGIGLILLHVTAAVWHQLIRRDHLLARMLPQSSRRL